jgi:hypothetical protein
MIFILNNKNIMAVVYQHKRPDTGEVFYIGVGVNSRRAFEIRNRNKHWRNVYNKVGREVEILHENVTYEKACEIEKEMIDEYGRIDLGTGRLVNMKEGGLNGVGWKPSEETVRKMSESQKGRVGAWNGKKHSEESIAKMRKPKPEGFNKGRKITWNTGKSPRKVVQKSLDGFEIKIWDSVKEINKELKIKVYDALEKKNRTAGGFIWDWV